MLRRNRPFSLNIPGPVRFSWTIYSLGMLGKRQLGCSTGVWPGGFNKGNMGCQGQALMEKPDGNFGRGLKHLILTCCFWCQSQKKDQVANVVCLTEKILTELLSSSPQINLALRLVRRSSSICGGFTYTTYGWNSDVHKRWIFWEGHRRCRSPKRWHRRSKWSMVNFTVVFQS